MNPLLLVPSEELLATSIHGSNWGAMQRRMKCLNVLACHLQILMVTNLMLIIKLSLYPPGKNSEFQLATRPATYNIELMKKPKANCLNNEKH